jgi:hypothetical protein
LQNSPLGRAQFNQGIYLCNAIPTAVHALLVCDGKRTRRAWGQSATSNFQIGMLDDRRIASGSRLAVLDFQPAEIAIGTSSDGRRWLRGAPPQSAIRTDQACPRQIT